MNKVYMRCDNDCYTACLATVLGLKYEDVPRFFDDDNNVIGDWVERVADFLRPHGLQCVTVLACPQLLEGLDGLYIVSGPSYTKNYQDLGHFHAVVYRQGELWHDPKPNPTGVIVPEQIDLLVAIHKGASCSRN